MEKPLATIIYTHDIKGELDWLPRLHTFIQTMRQAIEGEVFLVDLGGSCSPDEWHCQVTDGRAVLMGLDAMGYHYVNVNENLPPSARERLIDQIMMQLVDDDTVYETEHFAFQTKLTPSTKERVLLVPCDTPSKEPNVIDLPRLGWHQVGIVQVYADQWCYEQFTVAPHTLPDATIAGTVDFIRDEAKFYGKGRSDNK